MKRYNVRPVHRISPRESDAFQITYDGTIEASKPALGTLLRAWGVLTYGQRIHSCRVEGESIVAFPQRPCPWHSVIISPIA